MYDQDFEATGESDGPGVRRSKDFSPHGDRRTRRLFAEFAVVALESFEYSYDKAGNRPTMKDGTATTTYEYDKLHRLVKEVTPSGFTTTYKYDEVGNRVQRVGGTFVTNYVYDADDRMIHEEYPSLGWILIYEYDKNGNMVRSYDEFGSPGEFTYDYENRLLREYYPGSGYTCTWTYLPSGERSSSGCGTTTYYGYDVYGGGGFEDIVGEYDSGGTRQARYTHGPRSDETVGMLRGGSYYAYHTDALGSVTRLTDSAQGSARTYRYNGWGESAGGSGTLANPYQFAGRENDGGASSLYYNRARRYDPSVGRFTSKDPAGMADGPNLYAYVGNNPVNRADPSGMRFQEGPDDPPPSYDGGGSAGGSSSISASEPSSYGWPLRCWMGAVFLGIGIGFGLLGVYGAYLSPQMWSNILYYLFTSGTWTLFRAALSGNVWAWAQLIFSLTWWDFWTFIWSSIPWFAQAAFGVQLATWATPPRWVLALGDSHSTSRWGL